MNCLIGYTGFVGSFLMNKLEFNHKFNSKNIHEIPYFEYDTIYCCGISATKWYANLHPKEDLQNINKLLDYLKLVKCKKFILISTIDVYSENDVNEDSKPINTDAYGKNRYYAETEITKIFDNYHIIRLPGLFGFGLKKNIIFDLLNDKDVKLNLNSEYQWYDMNNIFADIEFVVKNDIKLINLFTEPITNAELLEVIIKYKQIDYTYSENTVKYNMKTKYSKTGYLYNKNNILSSLDYYVNIIINNNLCVSNLAYNSNFDYNILSMFGIKKHEIVPFKTFGENFINKDMTYFDEWKNKGIYSFQSLFYPLQNSIFDNESYFIKLIDIASHINAKILVLGNPKNRDSDNYDYAINYFKKLGDYAYNKNVIICIEPNATVYNCKFITNSRQARELILKVNSPGFKLHLDTGCMFLENENSLDVIKTNLDILKHIHFSVPHLKQLYRNCLITNFSSLFKEICKLKYGYVISLEMLNIDDEYIQKSIYSVFI